MALEFDTLLTTMKTSASTAFEESWDAVKEYALPELKKIAITLVDISQGLTDPQPYYTQESARVLLRMQLRASQAVLTATTALTLIAVEKAIAAILQSVKDMVNAAIGIELLA